MTDSDLSITSAPSEIRLSADRKTLQITFADGNIASLAAELLRVESPSAEVQGHGADQKTTPAGKRHVAMSQIDPVGNYAIRISFDDGHDTGIFSWSLLQDYATRRDSLMAAYIDRLAALGASRE
tara:strand:- start:296 stop:670 length:375 start_codon:yes stop_codon:yes gene_type:complete